MLNDPTMVHAAVQFATRIIEDGGQTDQERIDWAWRQATSRSVGEAMEVLLPLVRYHRQQYDREVGAATELIESSGLHGLSHAETTELAAWSSVARTILNLSEVITRN